MPTLGRLRPHSCSDCACLPAVPGHSSNTVPDPNLNSGAAVAQCTDGPTQEVVKQTENY